MEKTSLKIRQSQPPVAEWRRDLPEFLLLCRFFLFVNA